jgi:hypothetical protein
VTGDYYIYADAVVCLTNALIAGGTPYLPSGIALNVSLL